MRVVKRVLSSVEKSAALRVDESHGILAVQLGTSVY